MWVCKGEKSCYKIYLCEIKVFCEKLLNFHIMCATIDKIMFFTDDCMNCG